MEDLEAEQTKELFEKLKADILKEREKTLTLTLNDSEISLSKKSRFMPKPISINPKPK